MRRSLTISLVMHVAILAAAFIVLPNPDKFKVDVPLDQARAEDFDALLLPGGVANPDQLRMKPKAVEFSNVGYLFG